MNNQENQLAPEESENDEDNGSLWTQMSYGRRIFTFAMFMCMGSGANWVLPTALAQEIPYFENHQPEKLCIATYMNAATNLGLLVMACYLFYHYYVSPIPSSVTVPVLLVSSAAGCFLSAAVYSVTAGGVSLMLYLCCLIGGAVGAMSAVVMNPFMTQFENAYISAARSGGSALILLCAILASAQSPGSNNERFSTSAYMSIFGAILVLPIFAYRVITANRIGERVKKSQQSSDNSAVDEAEINPMMTSEEGHVKKEERRMSKVEPFSIASPTSLADSHEATRWEKHYSEIPSWSTMLDRKFHSFIDHWLPERYVREYPWLKRAIPYMLTVGWVNFNTWGVISAVTPFAIAHASSGSGSENLSIAYQVAAVALMLGDMSTAAIKMPIFYCLIFFSAFCFTVYAAAISSQGFQNAAAGPILIAVYALERFLEAHVVTSTYRAIATHFLPEHRQSASRAVGICDQLCTTLGTIFSTVLVASTFNCHSNNDDNS